MGKFLFKLERKYGQYAIRNLSLIIVVCYSVGYLIQLTLPNLYSYMLFNPYYILHGQIWRLFTWLLIPYSEFGVFTILILYCYFSIGKSLEMAWGDFKYNVYIFSGILFTVIGAFLLYGIAYMVFADELAQGVYTAEQLFTNMYIKDMATGNITYLPGGWFSGISTYYVSLSIFLGYALTYPENRMYLAFLIPVRAKILGIIFGIMVLYDALNYIVQGRYYQLIIIVMSLLNFVIFYFSTKNYRSISPSEMKRRAEYRRKIQWAKTHSGVETEHNGRVVITRHKCAICGRTELDGDLEFRFCSKCDGNYEYCKDHLFTHEHVKRI